MSAVPSIQEPTGSPNPSHDPEANPLITTERKTQNCGAKAMKLLLFTLGGTAAGTIIAMLIDSSNFTQMIVFQIGGSMIGLGVGMHMIGIK